MIRFRVVKGSHVLLALAVLALAAVATVILVQSASPPAQSVIAPGSTAEAKVLQTFASCDSAADEEGGLEISVLPDPTPTAAPTNGKCILIYHTHTHEAYAQVEDDPYVAVETWRTEDAEHSVVRLGARLAEELTARGYEVIHDRSDHEQQDINSAYVRSLRTLESYDERFDLTIDLHRDAYVPGISDCFSADGAEYAQLMLLVGRADAYEGDEKPDYEGNLRFAQRLTSAMNAALEGICRNVTVKKGRYNQHIGRRAILVEVGHNMNTLTQALNSIPPLADAIDTALQSESTLEFKQ